MTYLGDFALGSTVDFKFTTVTPSTGAPTDTTSGPAVACYPDNSTTEITAGITYTNPFDARTGLNHVRIVASAGNGYAAGSSYAVVMTAGTAAGVSLAGYVVGHFSIEARVANVTKVAGTTQTARDLGAQLDATVSSRLASASYTAPDNTTITAINAKTTNLPTDPADQSAVEAAITAAVTGLSTFNPAVTKVTPIDADGLTYVSAMEFLLAVLGGVAAPSGSTVAFKKRDGTTTKVTVSYGTVDGERTASVIT